MKQWVKLHQQCRWWLSTGVHLLPLPSRFVAYTLRPLSSLCYQYFVRNAQANHGGHLVSRCWGRWEHDDVMSWKWLPHSRSFVRGIISEWAGIVELLGISLLLVRKSCWKSYFHVIYLQVFSLQPSLVLYKWRNHEANRNMLHFMQKSPSTYSKKPALYNKYIFSSCHDIVIARSRKVTAQQPLRNGSRATGLISYKCTIFWDR